MLITPQLVLLSIAPYLIRLVKRLVIVGAASIVSRTKQWVLIKRNCNREVEKVEEVEENCYEQAFFLF
jgi:hypothetical protein